MEKRTDIIKMIKNPSNKELVAFYMDYISNHNAFKIKSLVKIYMKNHKRFENAKLRMHATRSLASRFSRISAKGIELNIIKKDGKLYIINRERR